MASGGGRVAPLGPPLVSFVLLLALLAASCLAKAPPEAKKKPPGPFWKPFGVKLANYTHFGQLWYDFCPLRAVKIKMQIRLDQKCSFGQATRVRVGGRGQATGALTGWTLDSSGRDSTRQTSAS